MRDQTLAAFVPVAVHASTELSTLSVAELFGVWSRLPSSVADFIVVGVHAAPAVTVTFKTNVPCCGNVEAISIGTCTMTLLIGATDGTATDAPDGNVMPAVGELIESVAPV